MGLAACLFAALPAFAGEDSGDDPGGSGSGQGPGDPSSGDPNDNLASGGDETVGTLPILGGGRIDLPFTRDWRGVQPAFYLEGRAADLEIAIQGARGRGFVSFDGVDPLTGRVRLAFHGNVIVTLDRDLATALRIDVGVAVPTSFGPGRATVAFGASPVRNLRLRPGLLPLPVTSMTAPGALDQGFLQVRTTNRTGVRSTHTVMTTADLVILGQD